MKPLLIPLPGNENLAHALAQRIAGDLGKVLLRRFPDQETYLRYETPVNGRSIALVCTLDLPDDKFLPLLFAAEAARDLKAARVGLIAPYLGYMRQDLRFKPGEAITSNYYPTVKPPFAESAKKSKRPHTPFTLPPTS